MRAATLTQSTPSGQPCWHVAELEGLFDRLFGTHYRTRLRGGAEEPFYRAARAGDDAIIHYTRDHFRSALHEVAHWCVAGERRRRQDDYGYWYVPDGRDAAQQQAFVRVEALPQAWELLFCAACGHPFRVSADNLDGTAGDQRAFEDAVLQRAETLLAVPSPASRGWQWTCALAERFRGTPDWRDDWVGEVFRRW